MKGLCYPRLKDTARLKKMSTCAWVTELLMDFGDKCTSKQAFLLALANGTFKWKEIAQIYSEVFQEEPSKSETYVMETFKKFKFCLEFSEEKMPVHLKYNPKDFIFNLQNQLVEKTERLETPAEMTIVLTKTCNFKCVYCYNSSGCENKIEMTEQDWDKVIEQASDLGVVKCTLTGGEPMTHPGFFHILEKLKEKDILTYICTNGSLIDDAAVQKFKELKTPMVQISMDSPLAEMHDALTQSKGTFPKIVSAVKKLVQAGIKVYIKAVVLPETMDKLPELVALCDSLGVTNLVLDQYDLCFVGRGSNRFFLNKEEQQHAKELVEEAKGRLTRDMNISFLIGDRCWKDEDHIVMCGAFIQSFIIIADGEYTVCEKLAGIDAMSVGNFKTMSLKEMWNSPRIEEILNPSEDKLSEPCKSCEYLTACNTGCFAAKQFVTDDLYAVDPRCFKAEYKENAFIVE